MDQTGWQAPNRFVISHLKLIPRWLRNMHSDTTGSLKNNEPKYLLH